MPDDLILEILALYEYGWEPIEISEMVDVPLWAVRDALSADADSFPHEPLRRVVH